jgi:Na+-driven multidrug efflux pump
MAIPNALVMFAQLSIGLIEVYFLARLGVDVLAGVSLVFPMLSWIGAVSQGAVGGGVVTAIARALGRGDRERASELVWGALALAIALGSMTTVAMFCLGPRFHEGMGAHGASLSSALVYSHLVFSGAILIWTFNLLLAAVRGTGNMILPLLVVCGGAVVLVPLSALLIFGYSHVPAFGVRGGAIAVLLYYLVGSLIFIFHLWGRNSCYARPICHPAWSGSPFGRSFGSEACRRSSVRPPILRSRSSRASWPRLVLELSQDTEPARVWNSFWFPCRTE